MSDPVRNELKYATADGQHVMVIDYPFGLILPPTISAHVPLVGEMTFYEAQCYQIKIQPGAEQRGLR